MTTHRLVGKSELIQQVKAERRATLALLRGLEPDRFDTIALPGWRVREVVAHLITTDKASVLGANLLILFGSSERLERWNDRQVPKWADRPVPELLIGLDRWGRRLVGLLRAIPQPVSRIPGPTFLGRAPIGIIAWSRVYDEWVHRQDMRRGLGMPDEEVDLAPAAEFLLTAIGVDTVSKLQGQTGRVAVSLKDAPITPWTYDLGAQTADPDGGQEADARISAYAPSFIMAAAGRERFEDLMGSGALSLEGDERLAREFLAELRIV